MDVQNKPGYLILQSATEARSLGSCSSCMLSGVIVSSMASFSLILGPGQVKQVTLGVSLSLFYTPFFSSYSVAGWVAVP